MKARVLALVVGALLVATAVPASAQGTFFGKATADGFRLTVQDQGLAVGFSEAIVQSGQIPDTEGCAEGVLVCARGAGELTLQGAAEASQPGGQQSAETTALDIPQQLSPLLTGSIGIAKASATQDPAVAEGQGAALETSITATQTVADNTPVDETLQTISDELLGRIADGDPTGVAERLKGTVDTLIERLDETPIATLTVGPSRSTSTEAGGITTATAQGQGAVLTISPTGLSLPTAPEGLIIVEAGAAKASATSDGFTPAAEFDAALVRIRVFDPTTGEYDVIAVDVGSQCVAEGTPLQVCVAVGGGETNVEGAGASAKAAGVRIEAFQEPLPPVVLALAGAEAVVVGAPAAPTPPGPAPAPDLPTTGVGIALPAIALLGAGGLGLIGLRRRG